MDSRRESMRPRFDILVPLQEPAIGLGWMHKSNMDDMDDERIRLRLEHVAYGDDGCGRLRRRFLRPRSAHKGAKEVCGAYPQTVSQVPNEEEVMKWIIVILCLMSVGCCAPQKREKPPGDLGWLRGR